MVAGKHRKSMNAVHGLLGGPKIEDFCIAQPARLNCLHHPHGKWALLSEVANASHGSWSDGFCAHTSACKMLLSKGAVHEQACTMFAAMRGTFARQEFCSPRSASSANKGAAGHRLCLPQGKGLIGAAAPEEGSDESEQTAVGPSSSIPGAAAEGSGSGTASTSSSSSSGAVTGQKRKRSHSDIKLLALDMDGTLLSSESKVLPSSVKAIKVG